MGSNLLVVNSGSSSLKFKLFNREANKLSAVVTGLVERIGETEDSRLVATNAKDTRDPGKQVFLASAHVPNEAHANMHLFSTSRQAKNGLKIQRGFNSLRLPEFCMMEWSGLSICDET